MNINDDDVRYNERIIIILIRMEMRLTAIMTSLNMITIGFYCIRLLCHFLICVCFAGCFAQCPFMPISPVANLSEKKCVCR